MDQPLPRRQEISGDVDSLAASSPGSATAVDMREQQCLAYARPADVHLQIGRSSWEDEQDILNYVQSKVGRNAAMILMRCKMLYKHASEPMRCMHVQGHCCECPSSQVSAGVALADVMWSVHSTRQYATRVCVL